MKLLDLRKILETFMRFPSDVGINPTKLKFYEIKKIFKESALPTQNDDGILPVSWLNCRAK